MEDDYAQVISTVQQELAPTPPFAWVALSVLKCVKSFPQGVSLVILVAELQKKWSSRHRSLDDDPRRGSDAVPLSRDLFRSSNRSRPIVEAVVGESGIRRSGPVSVLALVSSHSERQSPVWCEAILHPRISFLISFLVTGKVVRFGECTFGGGRLFPTPFVTPIVSIDELSHTETPKDFRLGMIYRIGKRKLVEGTERRRVLLRNHGQRWSVLFCGEDVPFAQMFAVGETVALFCLVRGSEDSETEFLWSQDAQCLILTGIDVSCEPVRTSGELDCSSRAARMKMEDVEKGMTGVSLFGRVGWIGSVTPLERQGRKRNRLPIRIRDSTGPLDVTVWDEYVSDLLSVCVGNVLFFVGLSTHQQKDRFSTSLVGQPSERVHVFNCTLLGGWLKSPLFIEPAMRRESDSAPRGLVQSFELVRIEQIVVVRGCAACQLPLAESCCVRCKGTASVLLFETSIHIQAQSRRIEVPSRLTTTNRSAEVLLDCSASFFKALDAAQRSSVKDSALGTYCGIVYESTLESVVKCPKPFVRDV